MKQVFTTLLRDGLLLGLAACALPQGSSPESSASTLHKTTIILPGQLEPSEVTYKVQDGWAVMEGDILLGRTEELAQNLSPQGYGRYSKLNLWPGGIIPYSIASSITGRNRERIVEVMSYWMDRTDITFVQRTTEADFVEFQPGSDDMTCSSFIGRFQGPQPIFLGPSGACEYGALVHEIGHAVGLGHEHTRPDRDQFITVNSADIIPAYVSQFDIQKDLVPYGSYDYKSRMHYSAYAFSRNGEPTIVPKNGMPLGELGSARDLSPGDIAAVKELYRLKALGLSTKYEDVANAVGFMGEYLYVLSRRDVDISANDISVVTLERYDRSGKLLWTREDLAQCPGAACKYRIGIPNVDAKGNVHLFVSAASETGQENTKLRSYDRNGTLTSETSDASYYDDFSKLAFAVAPNGDSYAAYYSKVYKKSLLTKSVADSGPVWIKPLSVGTPKSVALSPNGSDVYVLGDRGLSRYTSSGQLLWTKSGTFDEVVSAGTQVYARYRNTLYQFTTSGTQVWSKAQAGLNNLITATMTSDTGGNVYIAGKYVAGSGNWNPFVRKLTAKGSTVWTKTFGTGSYDDVVSIATRARGEIYLTGVTKGALAHANLGGTDGYLRRIDASGNPVWTR